MGPGWVGSEVFTTFGPFFKKKNTKSQMQLKSRHENKHLFVMRNHKLCILESILIPKSSQIPPPPQHNNFIS